MTNIWLINGTIMTGSFRQEKACVQISDGKIEDVISLKRFEKSSRPNDSLIYDVKGANITPGFIDTHIHGFAGYGTEDGDPNSILKMSEALAQYGVTAFCPTVYTHTEAHMIKALKGIHKAMGKEKGAQIMGIHMEGPFISPQRTGAQNAGGIQEVDLELMDRLYKAAGGKIVNMTVAPELKGMRKLPLSVMFP